MRNHIGVVIGRFQVPALTNGHTSLLAHVKNHHQTAVAFLGIPPVLNERNPLSYEMRAPMLAARGFVTLPLRDRPTDREWAKQVDDLLEAAFPAATFTIYGGRDSCIDRYEDAGGRWPIEEVETQQSETGTEVRNAIASRAQDSPAFRAGVIYSWGQRFKNPFSVVDIIVFKHDLSHVVLGRKKNEDGDKWRFFGGFVEMNELPSIAAGRELKEEAGIHRNELYHVGEALITDWRFGTDRLLTHVFATVLDEDEIAIAGDDIDELRQVNVAEVLNYIHPVHKDIAEAIPGVLANFRELRRRAQPVERAA